MISSTPKQWTTASGSRSCRWTALTVHKHNTNRWFELMGARVAAMEGADFDAIWHESATIPEFARISREKGLKVALEWRDDPFGDGRGAIRRRT